MQPVTEKPPAITARPTVAGLPPAALRNVFLRNVFLLAALAWLLVTAAYRAALAPGSITGIDFAVFYHAAQHLNAGLPLYENRVELYAYSPLMAVALRPLALLAPGAALKLWFGLNALCLVGAVAVYAAAARMTWRDAAPLALMLLVGFRCWPATMNFALGQANFLLLLLLCGLFWADARRRWALFAVLVAGAALIKIWMLGLLLYPLLRRDWRCAALSGGLYAAGLAALFTLVGWGQFGPFVRALRDTGAMVTHSLVTQSVYGFAHLHFAANAVVHPILPSEALFAAFLLAGLGAVAWGLLVVWRLPPLTADQSRLALGLVAVSVLLLLPPCQEEYVLLCLPALWTLAAPADAEAGATWRRVAAGALAYLLLSRGWGAASPVPEAFQHGLKSLLVSAPFYAAAVLWGATVAALRAARPAPAEAAP